MNVVFKWEDSHVHAFNTLKDKLTNARAPLFCLPNFDKAFEGEWDKGAVLM